jgi:L-arabinokinase
VALYVTGHGFGHAVRCAEVARTLLDRGAQVLLRTHAPRWLFPDAVQSLPGPPDSPLDVGVAQRDGLDLDVDETRRRWEAFDRAFDARAEQEARLLRASGADVLLGDVPPLAFAAAARAGIPGFALGNFGWDWIYAIWPSFDRAIARVREGYGQASALLRLPFHGDEPDAFPAFHHIEDVPLIARFAREPRERVRAALGFQADQRLVLLSFGGFDTTQVSLEGLSRCRDYHFLVTPVQGPPRSVPANVHVLPRPGRDYVSLLAACDAVVTKPGYGIVADCLANRVPTLYTDRGPFREYDVLAHALETLGRAVHVHRDTLRQGSLEPSLDRLLAMRAPWADLSMDGAAAVADRLLAGTR